VIYLLDVNALIGLAWAEHQFHSRMGAWVITLDRDSDLLATCAISELGLVRIVPQLAAGSSTIKEAQETLARVKATSILPFTFIADNVGADRLPSWVRQSKQTTDGHLLELAKAHKAIFATCDQKIHGAFLIPA
jgi:predicted nucleic acid-binding protein